MRVALGSPEQALGSHLAIGGDVALGPAAPRLDDELAGLVRAAEVAVVNLEAPLVERAHPAPKAGPHLQMAPSAAATLAGLGIGVVGLANNHVGDHGPDGVLETLRHCRAAGLECVGAGADAASAGAPLSVGCGGARLAIFAVAEAEYGLAAAGRPGAAPAGDPALARRIAAARADHDVVVVLAHGGVEEIPVAPVQRRDALRDLVDAGADLVVGHHPHVPQGWEAYGDGVVVHSVGDLLFDRAEGPAATARDAGMLVAARISEGRLDEVLLVPCERRAGQVGHAPALGPPLERLAALVGAEEAEGLWQELAHRVFAERYLPLLARIGVPVRPAPAGPPVLRTLRDVAARLNPSTAVAEPADWEARILANYVRCESHRWTLETALGLLGGTLEDRRTTAVRGIADELLAAWG